MSFYRPIAYPRAVNERRHDRYEVNLEGRVRELGLPAVTGRVKDVSIGGCRLNDTDLPRNAEIWVCLGPSKPVRARVVWVGSGEAGCEFYAPLSRADLRKMMLESQA
jgi:hypothetical protein